MVSSSIFESFQSQIQSLQKSLDTPDIPWKQLVLVLLSINFLFDFYISLRQYPKYSLPSPPAQLAAHVDLETFQKSQKYGKAKAQFAFFSSLVGFAENMAIVYFDVLAIVWTQAGSLLNRFGWEDKEIVHSILFMVILFIYQSVPSIPMALYKNFVLEEAFGFNKMTYSTYFADTVKEWLVGFVIGAPLMSGLIAVIRWAGDAFVAYVVGFLLVFQITAMILYPTVIQPLFNKLTPLQEGALKDRVVALASALKFPLKHLYVIDGSKRSAHSNAYFFGVIPGGNKHIVIFDTLIEKSTPDEIEAVLAHELGHWAHSDPTKLLVLGQAQLLMTMSLFTLFIHNSSLFRAFGFNVNNAYILGSKAIGLTPKNYLPIIVGLELFQLVLSPTDALLKFGMNSAVRRMEYAADRFAAGLSRPPPTASELKAAEVHNEVEETKDGKGAITKVNPHQKEEYSVLLSRALIKLHVQNLSTMHHDHLYATYHYSHPTLAERLSHLEKIEQEKQLKSK